MEQLLCHLFGDYVLQSHIMAINKTKYPIWAVYHGIMYSLPFIFIASPNALFVIAFTHVIIDYLGLAKEITKVKNYLFGNLNPQTLKEIYPQETPEYVTFWLLILLDNTMHLTINYFSIRYL